MLDQKGGLLAALVVLQPVQHLGPKAPQHDAGCLLGSAIMVALVVAAKVLVVALVKLPDLVSDLASE